MNGLKEEKDSSEVKFIRDCACSCCPYRKSSHTTVPENFKAHSSENEKVYILPGIPIPLARTQHGNGQTWDPQKQKKVMSAISISALHGSRPKFSGPLHMNIKFYFPIPQRGQRSKTTWIDKYHDIKPDISNCIKYIEDVCNKLLYEDDSAIASIYSKKLYDHNPRTEFIIVELK